MYLIYVNTFVNMYLIHKNTFITMYLICIIQKKRILYICLSAYNKIFTQIMESRFTYKSLYVLMSKYWTFVCVCLYRVHTDKTIFPFPFTLNGIWSWGQFSFRFSEKNEIPFGSKSKGKLSPRSYPIQGERKWKHSFLSV